MNTIEQAEATIKRARELEQAVKDGKSVELKTSKGAWEKAICSLADDFYSCIMIGMEYRIIEPKRRRPWTKEEAEAHLGWVLVSRGGRKTLFSGHEDLSYLQVERYNVHPIGQPDQLKPCWVEE